MDTLVQSLMEQKKRLAIGAGSVLAGAVVLIGYFQSGPDALHYARAEDAFLKWEASPENEQLYKGMQQAVQSAPLLKKKYETAIAQKLLDMKRLDEALILANHSLERVRGETPFHSAYAQTSLLIQQGEFQRALESAVALKEQMQKTSLAKAGGLLHAYNLLRIACLQKELKNRAGEKAGWEELEGYLTIRGDLAKPLLSHFGLLEYMTERKRAL